MIEWISSKNPPHHKGEYLVILDLYSYGLIHIAKYDGSGWYETDESGKMHKLENVSQWAIKEEGNE